jgi:sulfate/thiosulfate transport system permease protein
MPGSDPYSEVGSTATGPIVASGHQPSVAGGASVPVLRSDVWHRRALVTVVIVYIGVLVVAPLAALVVGALQEGIGAMLRVLTQPDVLAAFRLTMLIGLITVAVHAVLGTATAWMLVRDDFRGKALINGLIDMPFAISPVVVGYMIFLLFGRTGLLAPLTNALGIKVAFALPGMILVTLFVTLPFMIRELVPVLRAFGTEPERAAATLGASGWQTFWRVTLPALRWGFIYGVTLTFARALGEFGAVLVVGGGVQGRTETATLYIYRALDERQYVGAYTVAIVLGALSLALVLGTDLVRRRHD